MSTLTEQITQLEAAIAAQETLRPTLGDAAVDAVIASVCAQLESLRTQQRPTDEASLNAQLTRLEQAELIRLYVQYPDVEYIFKHALTQDAAYESLLMTERKELHRRVGSVMEALFAGRLDTAHGIVG